MRQVYVDLLYKLMFAISEETSHTASPDGTLRLRTGLPSEGKFTKCTPMLTVLLTVPHPNPTAVVPVSQIVPGVNGAYPEIPMVQRRLAQDKHKNKELAAHKKALAEYEGAHQLAEEAVEAPHREKISKP